MVTIPSSRGCRRDSKALRENSGNSSKNSTPLWARLISPGLGVLPPPINPTLLMVWWGDLNGLSVTKGISGGSKLAILYNLVISIDSSKVKEGRMVGSLRASIVFPEPGGPIIITLWLPAAATSKALLACSCPLTSAKSIRLFLLSWKIVSKSMDTGTMDILLFKNSTTS